MIMKKILIHSLVFNPDGVSTAYLYGDIARALKEKGHSVVVLTTTPHYNKVQSQIDTQQLRWKIPGFLKMSCFNGIPVYHVPQKKFKSTGLRLLGFVYWHIVSFLTALFIKKVDVIISPSPPLTIGLLNAWLGKIKGAKVVYNVQEVYPDILGKKDGIVYSTLSRMEHYIYDKSDAVTTIDKIFYDTIQGRFKEASKLHIIPNFVDTEIYKPLDSFTLDPNLFIENDHIKLLYAGNIGMAQDWETLIELAQMTKGKPFDYYVIGEGSMRDYLAGKIKEKSLTNIHLLPYQPRQMMPQIIAFSDIQFIFMEPKVAAQGFPSKVYTIMACAKPLLVCSPLDTPICRFLEPCHCAKLIKEVNPQEKATQISVWLQSVDRAQLQQMGQEGVSAIRENFSKEVITQKYIDLVNSL